MSSGLKKLQFKLSDTNIKLAQLLDIMYPINELNVKW